FFSSRRRHTRWPRDWSSDVCSSDLPQQGLVLRGPIILRYQDRGASFTFHSAADIAHDAIDGKAPFIEPPDQDIALVGVHHDRSRSEERRVGKECRLCGGGA